MLENNLQNEVKKKKKEEVVPPSAESGGVPEPSPAYRALASHPPFVLPVPRVILVVIDLNGTLLYRPWRNQPTEFVMRPYAREFLSYCIRTFRVVIWSSAKIRNIDYMLDKIVSAEQRKQLVAVWGREKFNLSPADAKRRVMCYKRLTKLWDNTSVQLSHPEASSDKRWDQTNTLLIDDSREKGRSEPYNIVHLPEFKGDFGEEGYILPQVHDYVNECSRRTNISAYMRETPFVIKEGFQLRPQTSEANGYTGTGQNNGMSRY
ncbi:HAD-like domain-containing protein [Annulohypoxylon bovei var. microspora]|nr:HAD-like domain-containing protein [Annulohypoxylon bovei var. microspora]